MGDLDCSYCDDRRISLHVAKIVFAFMHSTTDQLCFKDSSR